MKMTKRIISSAGRSQFRSQARLLGALCLWAERPWTEGGEETEIRPEMESVPYDEQNFKNAV